MNLQEWRSLVRGDKIVYTGKPNVVWTVDHPTSTSSKKEFMNKYPLDNDPSNNRRMAEPCNGGGGRCPRDNMCIKASMILNNGRGAPRHFQIFSDPENWTKLN